MRSHIGFIMVLHSWKDGTHLKRKTLNALRMQQSNKGMCSTAGSPKVGKSQENSARSKDPVPADIIAEADNNQQETFRGFTKVNKQVWNFLSLRTGLFLAFGGKRP